MSDEISGDEYNEITLKIKLKYNSGMYIYKKAFEVLEIKYDEYDHKLYTLKQAI